MMTRLFTAAALAATVLVPTAATAQGSANPYTDAVKAQLAQVKTPIIRTAEKVPEDPYSFKPTPEVRSLGQLIGHIADANFNTAARAAARNRRPTAAARRTPPAKPRCRRRSPIRSRSARRCWRPWTKKGAESIKFITGPTPLMGKGGRHLKTDESAHLGGL